MSKWMDGYKACLLNVLSDLEEITKEENPVDVGLIILELRSLPLDG